MTGQKQINPVTMMIRIGIILLSVMLYGLPCRAQTTEGTDFWLTFGANATSSYSNADLQIRIVSGNNPTRGTIHFSALGTSVEFDMDAHAIYPCRLKTILTSTQMQHVFNNAQGKTKKSIRITTDEPVTVFALNQYQYTTDATNVLPVTVLGDDYYHMSYEVATSNWPDAYAIVATEDDTEIFHNGSRVTIGPFNTGEVYYKTSTTDMTGAHITTNRPVAFFAVHQGAQIPLGKAAVDCLMQQLPPVNTWGKNFYVPVSHCNLDIARVVASQDSTTITPIGSTITPRSVPGGKKSLKNLMRGEFVEFDVSGNGCYFQADKPVGVCTYLTGIQYHMSVYESDPAQCWLPAIEQTTTGALISPFIPSSTTALNKHFALLITPTATKENTKVTVGTASDTALSGGAWIDNDSSGMSIYRMPLNNASYYFTNKKGLIILCYGVGSCESYYFLASSSMRDLEAVFFANEIFYKDLQDHVLCVNEVAFRAEINLTLDSLSWYIDDVEEISARDSLEWTTSSLSPGEHKIKMLTVAKGNIRKTIEGTLKIGSQISVTASPAEGGSVYPENECYETGTTVNLTASANPNYILVNWTENGTPVSTDTNYEFTADGDRTLVANFKPTYTITVSASSEVGGTASGGGIKIQGESVTVTATPSIGYEFINWMENGVSVSTDADYNFIVECNRTLIANFTKKIYTVAVSSNPPTGGNTTGGGNYKHGANVTVMTTPAIGYNFVNWTEVETHVSSDTNHNFIVEEHRTLVANFTKKIYTISVSANPATDGSVTGSDVYEHGTKVTVSASPNNCYQLDNWTVDDTVVSINNPYTFPATDNVNLVANIRRMELDFDTYCPILWDNTLMLNLRLLREDGYEAMRCKWFKNGIEEPNTRTVDEFSYSAGPEGYKLEVDPTCYRFQIMTQVCDTLFSTEKRIAPRTAIAVNLADAELVAYPNPVSSDSPLTLVGTVRGSLIQIYHHTGILVKTAIADENTTTLTLHLPSGIYVLRVDNKEIKILVKE